jgi:hypoxanthine-DNA glycosylase
MEPSKGFAPVAGEDARTLVLGSLPGQKSLAEQQYYAHPQNAFWRIMRDLYGIGGSYDDRCRGLVENKIALWDVLKESERPGSMDADIRANASLTNDFEAFLSCHSKIAVIAFNGRKSEQLFQRMVHLPENTKLRYVGLPSTSPAYASLSVSGKLDAWRAGLWG